ncbi:Crp/Fnr family transcriptional regulator, partial [bacterium]|nr:Crp/Fnr family transcriptional regulator [bacterium]
GETLIPAGIILEGRLEISFQNNNDDSVNMNHFQSGETFGEAMVLADIPRSPMQAKTLENTVILFLNYKMLYIKPSDYPYAGRLALNLLQSFALKNVFLNQKIRIFSQKTLRDKILTYLNKTLPKDQTGGLKLPFSKTSAAEFLGVNRSALSRELGRMKSEGMLREQDGKIYLPLKQN